ncbi:unnamed protein product [Discosporangium mesarthrocarpum]
MIGDCVTHPASTDRNKRKKRKRKRSSASVNPTTSETSAPRLETTLRPSESYSQASGSSNGNKRKLMVQKKARTEKEGRKQGENSHTKESGHLVPNEAESEGLGVLHHEQQSHTDDHATCKSKMKRSEFSKRKKKGSGKRKKKGGGLGGVYGAEDAEITRGLSRAIVEVRTRHRNEVGRGRPLVGWDILNFAEVCYSRLEMMEEEVSEAVEAVGFAADERHDGKVTLDEFEVLVREEAKSFGTRRQSRALLDEALVHEQAGDLERAEACCEASLEVWPACARAHLKLARLLRAGGASRKRAIHDVKDHLMQALSLSTPKAGAGAGEAAGAGAGNPEVAEESASLLSLLLCQEGQEREAAGLLKRQGFRYRLSPQVLRYAPPSEPAPEQGRGEGADKTCNCGNAGLGSLAPGESAGKALRAVYSSPLPQGGGGGKDPRRGTLTYPKHWLRRWI